MRKRGRGGWGRLVKVGGGAFVAPRGDDRVGDLLKRHGPPQCSSERGLSACGLWLATYGCNDLLRAIEQDRPMLQECASLPDLCRAHQLATGDEDLATDRSREARRGLVDPAGWWRLMGRQSDIGTEGPKSRDDPLMDGVVGVTQRAERRHRGGDCVRHLMLVPHRAAAGGASDDVEPELGDGGAIVAGRGRLVPAQREARRGGAKKAAG